MHTVRALELVKTFLEEQVSPNIRLQKASDEDVLHYELVHPNVFIGWVPPQGYLPENLDSNIPCLVVGLDTGVDTHKESEFDIKISFAVYSPGEHKPDSTYTPNFKGYIDLLNLMDLTKAKLSQQIILGNKLKISDEIKWGMYQDQPYPYWYGYMTFSLQGSAYPRVEVQKLLNE